MKLNNLKPAEGSTHSRRRIGRGPGSGLGGTSTRGHKGAKAPYMQILHCPVRNTTPVLPLWNHL